MTQNKIQKFEQELWYIIVNNETRGPLSLRDLDVLFRTSQINSGTYAWKNGMLNWKILSQIEQIKDSILQSSKQIFEIQKKRGQIEVKPDKTKKQGNQDDKKEDQIIQNKDQNVMAILQATADNLLQKTFHQTQDGKWNIYDQQKGEWIQQDQEPTEEIQKMKKNLFNKLKNQLFFDQKNIFKRGKKPILQEDQKQLTKQQLAKKQRNRRKTKRAAQKKKEKWYQAKMNTFIYITGLPLDITQNQLKDFCSKAGLLRIDLSTGTEKIKIYKDQNGLPKGDAAASYAREESVQIALQLLNGAQIRSGFKVKVQKAQFHQKYQQYIPRESKKQSKVKKIKQKLLNNKLFGWNEDDEATGQGLKIIVIKNVFTGQILQNDNEIQNIKKEIQKEIQQIGEIKRIRFFQTHPEGVVEVKFKNQKDAEFCTDFFDKKIFHGRQLQCDYWDGQADFKHNTTSLMLQNQRLDKFACDLQKSNANNQNLQQVSSRKGQNGDKF